MPPAGPLTGRVLDALAELYAPTPEPDMAVRVIGLAGRALPADSCSYTGFGPAGTAVRWRMNPAEVGAFPDGARLFRQHVGEHPVLAHQRHTGDGRDGGSRTSSPTGSSARWGCTGSSTGRPEWTTNWR